MSGIFTEVVFTSLKTLYYHQDFELHGNTQLWVIIIYALGGLLFERVHLQVENAVTRVGIYLSLVYILEYSFGWVLFQLLGRCPWHYHEPGNIHGLVQLNYIPLWLCFVVLADREIYYALNYELIKVSALKNYNGNIITAMSEDNNNNSSSVVRDPKAFQESPPAEKTWFVMGDYKPEESKDLLQQQVEELTKQVRELDSKMEKLIQSNKSLIAYLSAVNNRDIRDLNYRIRGYSSKSKQLPPIAFVPDRTSKYAEGPP